MQPILRALAQLDDPALQSVLWRSLLWSAAGFLLLAAGAVWGVHHLAGLQGWLAWALDAASGVAAAVLAFWLFVPLAAAIGTLFIDRIADAVEQRHYPWLPPAPGAPWAAQLWDAVVLGARILLLNLVGLLAALLLPGIGLLVGWAIAAYAIGRGLFVAVALRRVGRRDAASLYARHRGTVLLQGAILAAAGFVPLLHLLVPVLGVAAMVHVLDRAATPPLGSRR
jgi:uncharacterized protein involved in cysteine biosynthesis